MFAPCSLLSIKARSVLIETPIVTQSRPCEKVLTKPYYSTPLSPQLPAFFLSDGETTYTDHLKKQTSKLAGDSASPRWSLSSLRFFVGNETHLIVLEKKTKKQTPALSRVTTGDTVQPRRLLMQFKRQRDNRKARQRHCETDWTVAFESGVAGVIMK